MAIACPWKKCGANGFSRVFHEVPPSSQISPAEANALADGQLLSFYWTPYAAQPYVTLLRNKALIIQEESKKSDELNATTSESVLSVIRRCTTSRMSGGAFPGHGNRIGVKIIAIRSDSQNRCKKGTVIRARLCKIPMVMRKNATFTCERSLPGCRQR